MKVEATVDVGDNITRMLEQLAAQIGTTADKVFPWYVQQAYLQGVTTATAILVALLLFGSIFVLAGRKSNFEEFTLANVLTVISGILLAITFAFVFLAGPQQYRKVVNPNFYAMTMLADDIGKIRAGWRLDRDR